MCVCWEGHGRVFPLDHLLPNPTNLPSISIPSRKKIRDFLSCHELRYGSVIMKWIKKKNNTPGCRHREQTYGQNGGKGWKVGGKTKKEETYVCLWLIHVDIWQKPTQYYKAIILQLKINFKKSSEKKRRAVNINSIRGIDFKRQIKDTIKNWDKEEVLRLLVLRSAGLPRFPWQWVIELLLVVAQGVPFSRTHWGLLKLTFCYQPCLNLVRTLEMTFPCPSSHFFFFLSHFALGLEIRLGDLMSKYKGFSFISMGTKALKTLP